MPSDDNLLKGCLRFFNTEKRRPAAHWCRLTGTVEPRKLDWLLQTEWSESLPQEPRALISVVGASTKAELASMPVHDELELSRGLARAARASNAWVLMGGTHTGAARLVGRAMTAAPDVPCLGVAAWSHVDQRTELAASADAGVYSYTTGRHVDRDEYAHNDEPGEDGAQAVRRPLEPRVTHFLLADGFLEAGGATRTAEGNSHELRRAIENVLSPPPSSAVRAAPPAADDAGPADNAADAAAVTGGRSAKCPMVLVVMGGGLAVLDTVAAAMRDGRPVIVVPSCGHASADIHEMLFGGAAEDGDGVLPASLSLPVAGSVPARSEEYRQRAPQMLRSIRSEYLRRKGTRAHPLVRSFRASPAAAFDTLPKLVLSALLSFHDSAANAARCAVGWRGPTALRYALGVAGAEQPLALSLSLERALQLRSPQAVEALTTSYHLTPSFCRLDALCEDPMFRRAYLAASSPEALSSVPAFAASGTASAGAGSRQRSSQLSFSSRRFDRMHPANCPGSASGFAMLIAIVQPHEPTYTDELRLRWRRACDLEAATRRKAIAAARGSSSSSSGVIDAVLRPSWFDLMMWAVCVGDRRIARAMWRECEQPLRAAIVAARLARSLATSLSRPDSRATFRADADVYESLAMGVLDVATGAEALLLLLYTSAPFGDRQRSCLAFPISSIRLAKLALVA